MHKRVNEMVKFFALALLVSGLGCAQIKTRKQIETPKSPQQTGRVEEPQSSLPEAQDEDFQAPPEMTPQQKTAPRLGLILGAGGAKTFAHAGVLKALDTERIPIHAVVGLEWGALMAGVYAQEGRVHNLDWKLYKMQDRDLPGQSLLSKAFSKDGVAVMSPYLKTVFENSTIESAKIPFACPSMSTRGGSVGWMERGPFRSAVEACLPYSPLFAAKDGRFAAPFDLEQAAQWLRRQGADIVVFVDVLSEGEVWPASDMPSDESARLLWWEIQRRYRMGGRGVDEVLKVPLKTYSISSFPKRKQISDAGASAGRELSRRLMQKYNF